MTTADITDLVSSLYEVWYSSVVRFASRRLGSVQAAEDIVQDAFIQLFGELVAGKVVENPRAWTFCVVRRQVMSHLGEQRRQCGLNDLDDILDTIPAGWVSPVELESDSDRLQKLLAVLTKREEEVVHLRLAAMKYREIAEALQISESSVNTLLIRALKKLKQASAEGKGDVFAKYETREVTPKTLH